MNPGPLYSIPALAFSGLLMIAAGCTPATRVDPDVSDAPPDTQTTAAAPAPAQTQDEEAQPTNVIERFWAPFDNAVDDFNKEINEGDPDTPTGSDE